MNDILNGKTVTMDRLSPGESAVVEHIERSALSDRLSALGLTEGTAVSCLFRAPLGDPVAYDIRGAVIALRREDSGCVSVVRGGDVGG